MSKKVNLERGKGRTGKGKRGNIGLKCWDAWFSGRIGTVCVLWSYRSSIWEDVTGQGQRQRERIGSCERVVSVCLCVCVCLLVSFEW